MPIDSKVEEAARELLGLAIRGELDKYSSLAEALGNERYLEASSLCLRVAGYIVIDACGRAWPTDADLRRIAGLIGHAEMKVEMDETDVYNCLAHSALGFRPLLDVFPDPQKAATIPFFVTATMLVAYRPEGKHWWQYLDLIEKALEDAAPVAEETVPAVLLLDRRTRALKEYRAD